MISKMVPWWLKIILKIILARLPMNIHTFWRRIGMFRHGSMDKSSYAISNFHALLDYGEINSKQCQGKTILEVGPGDSIATGVIAANYGMQSILIDVGSFATKQLKVYQNISNELKHSSDGCIDLGSVTSFQQILAKCRTKYLIEGTSSLAKVDDNSVDIVISQACLEHVSKKEFTYFVEELYRVTATGGSHIHSIDFKDHLGYSLNNLRFSDSFWESDLVSSSGFYTNRLRFSEMIKIFIGAGFDVVKEKTELWDVLPLEVHKFHEDFHDYELEDFRIKEAVVVLLKNL